MEYSKEMDIVILVTIRNNETVPFYKTHKLFDNKWHIYCYRFIELTHEGLFKICYLDAVPGLHGYELATKGKIRLTELLAERSNEIKKNLAKLERPTKAPDPRILNGITRIISSVAHLSSRV
jgi:hypothetical protein